eukprot:289586-Pleurochrysis_carterae.AAC.3
MAAHKPAPLAIEPAACLTRILRRQEQVSWMLCNRKQQQVLRCKTGFSGKSRNRVRLSSA